MLSVKRKSEIIAFPVSVFETADTKDDLEDWLLSQSPEFLKRMRKTKKDDIEGRGRLENRTGTLISFPVS